MKSCHNHVEHRVHRGAAGHDGSCSCPPAPLATQEGSNLDAHFGQMAEVRMLLSFQRPPRLLALAASRGGGERIDQLSRAGVGFKGPDLRSLLAD